ncbi:MAG: hypothetical protein IJQ42_05880 [Oscillospiraceae bacterium]|nr:hypothetical protein [Oscillospiraceae bacterium]
MPGFLVSDQFIDIELINRYPERCVKQDFSNDHITLKRNTLNKYMRDKAFVYTTDISFVCDGVILNLTELHNQFHTDCIEELIPILYRHYGEQFFSHFIGSFSGALFDYSKNLWLVWTNHTGEKSVFYSSNPNLFVAGSQVNYLIDAFRERGIQLSFDEQAAYQMLTFGFMEGDSTYANEIKRLRGGQYLRYQDKKHEVKEYFMLHKHPERFNGKTENQIIEELDRVFRAASELEYAKDEEYGYEHLADLSGGLDARMNMWVAHTIKPKHIQFITYCKANYLDELIAKQLAAYWNDEILVKPLDDVTYLYEIDEIVFMNAGLSLYTGITGGKRMLEHINFDVYGIEHTGQVNGAIIGSYYSAIGNGQYSYPTGMYSEKLKDRLSATNHGEFDDHELYLLYTRGFRGILNTQLIRSNYTEAFTTTIHPEVLQLCMDVPMEQRVDHKLYKKWILSKYPDAARYKWEKTGALITEGKTIGFVRKVVRRGPAKLKRMLGKTEFINTGMNPIDYWIAHNQDVRKFLDAYETTHVELLRKRASSVFLTDLMSLYENGNASEKAMVLTVLAAVKLYFGESKNEQYTA